MIQDNIQQIEANLRTGSYISLTDLTIKKFKKLANKVASRSKISAQNFDAEQIRNIYTLFHEEASSLLGKKLPTVDIFDCDKLQLSSALKQPLLDLLEWTLFIEQPCFAY